MSQDDSKGKYKSQTNVLYDHPRDLADLIYRKLGVAEGFVSFQHKLQFLEALIDAIQVIQEAENAGMCINENTKKPIKTKLDRKLVNKLLQVWEKGGYLYTKYRKNSRDWIDIESESYLLEPPDWKLSEFEELARMPALFSLKSKDEISSEDFFMRINEAVPEREAYRWQDPIQLCENGQLEYEKNGMLIPFFKTHQDITNSTNFTMHVPRLYYDVMTTVAWREAKKWVDKLRVNLWLMAQELEELKFASDNEFDEEMEVSENEPITN